MRFYDPGLGKFIGRDLLKEAVAKGRLTQKQLGANGIHLGANSYAYADSDTVNATDPSGREPASTDAGVALAALPLMVASDTGEVAGSNLSVALLGGKSETDDNAGSNKNFYIYREYRFKPSQRGASVVWQTVEFDYWFYGVNDSRVKHYTHKYEEFFVIHVGTPTDRYTEYVPAHDVHALPKKGGAKFQDKAIEIPKEARHCTFQMKFDAFEAMTFLENGVVVPRDKIVVDGDWAVAEKKHSYKDAIRDSLWRLDVTYYWCCALGEKLCCKTQRVGLLSNSDIYVKA